MAKKGNNNKNKVTRPDANRFQELNDSGKVKHTDARLDTSRRKMKAYEKKGYKLDTRRGKELLEQEEKHISKITKIRGEQLKQIKDLSSSFDDIFSSQQDQTKAVEQLYGIQNKLADKLQLAAGFALETATAKRETRDMSLEEANINARTRSDLQEINRLKLDAVSYAQKLTLFNKDNIPYYDKIKKYEAEIAVLSQQVGDNVDTENAFRLETLRHMKKEYQTLGKLEESNARKEEIQSSINDLMSLQGTAAGRILRTLKNIITNPLVIFTGLLALGVSRYETMRQRGNDLAEEMDRVNKKLAGAGPYQDAIISRAKEIHSIFRAAGEGFSSSLDSAVDAVQSLQEQLGNIGMISKDLVNLMSTIKLSINLSDEQSAKVIDTYLTIGDHSEKAAINSAEMLYSMSEQVGLNPADTFREVANATGETLAFIKGGTQELNNTIIAAKKMGLGLEDVASIARGLLDFETSIEAEMQAQLLTGMNLNFNKARMFAMNREGAKAAEEVMRQVGGLERFQNMNIFQQEAVAKATGLTVDELLKTNVQREREKAIAKEKQGIHDDTAKMLPIVTNVMGKLETGLGVIEKIANILGDVVLDVFGVSFKEAEELILRFVQSDTFKTGLKNVLFFMKGVIDGIVDVISSVWGFLKQIPWLDNLVKNMGSMDMSGGFSGAQKVGKTTGKVLAYGYVAKKVLGLTPFTAMWVQSAGGALQGLGSSIAKGIKGLLGYGGQTAGTTGLAGSVSTAGYLAAGAFIAKGMYDVATLSGKSTRSEKAGAVGGLVGAAAGAKLGAMAGTAIFPGVGTAIGAAIGAAVGYFGGDAIKHLTIFQDSLDKSRIKLADSQFNLKLEAQSQNNHLQNEIVKAQNKVRSEFHNLGLATDGATKSEIKDFADSMLNAGNITAGDHKKAIQGGMSAVELLERAAAGSTGKLTREQEARKVWVANQLKTQDLELQNRIQYNTELYKTVELLSDDMIEDQTTESGLSDRGKIDYVLNPFRTAHDREVLVRELNRLYAGAVPYEKIQSAVEDASHGMDIYVTKTDAVESGLEDLRDQLLQDIELQLNNDTRIHNNKKLSLMKKSSEMVYDPETGGLTVTVKQKAVILKHGGVTKKFDGGAITGVPGISLPVETPEYKQHKEFGGTADDWDFENNISHFQASMNDQMNMVMPSSTLGAGGEMDMHAYATTGGGTRGIQEQIAMEETYAERADLMKGVRKDGHPNQQWGFSRNDVAKWIDFNEDSTREASAAEIKYHNNIIKQPGMGVHDDIDNYRGSQAYGADPYGSLLWGFVNQGFDWFSLGDSLWKNITFQNDPNNNLRKGAGSMQNLKQGSQYRRGYRYINSGYTDNWGERHKGMDAYYTNELIRFQTGRDKYDAVRNKLDKNIGLDRYDYDGNRKSNKFMKDQVGNIAQGSGISTMQAVAMLVGVGPAALIKIMSAISGGWGALSVGMSTGPTMAGVFTAIEGYLGAETLLTIAKTAKNIHGGDMEWKDLGTFLSQQIKPVSYIGKAVKAYDYMPDDPVSAIMQFAGEGFSQYGVYAEKVAKALWKGQKRANWAKDGYYQFLHGMFEDTGVFHKDPDGVNIKKELIDRYGRGAKSEEGGITPNVKQVNDMILSADGELIETHEDDNLIIRKGGITQTDGGSGGNNKQLINSLLRELIIVSNNTVVEVDGKVISEAA